MVRSRSTGEGSRVIAWDMMDIPKRRQRTFEVQLARGGK